MGGRGASSGGTGGGFKVGDTPKAINPSGFFRVEKLTSRGNQDYGNLVGSDVKGILRGYKFNGLFWEKKGSTSIFTVNEV